MPNLPTYSFVIDAAGRVSQRGVDRDLVPRGAVYMDADTAAGDIYGPFDAESRDLIRIASAVATADRLSLRRPKGLTRLQEELCWPRRISVTLTLESPTPWVHVTDRLADLLYFLTDDEWTFAFEAGAEAPPEPIPLFPEEISPESEVVLFSGGLDSACGAYLRAQALAGTDRRVVAVTSFGHTVSRKRVWDVFTALGHRETVRWCGFEHQLKAQDADEDGSRRARGFYFLAVASALAKRIGVNRVLSFETGVGALSTPMNAAQAGAQNTRAMHPRTVAGCEAIFRETLNWPVSLEQPYFFDTKGELCKAAGSALELLALKSITCNGGGQRLPIRDAHCGLCTSCLYRRSSLHAALAGRDPTSYRSPPKNKKDRGYQLFAFENQAVELARASLAWPTLLAYDPNIRHAVARFSSVQGTSPQAVQAALCSLFRRHAAEALAYLREANPLPQDVSIMTVGASP